MKLLFCLGNPGSEYDGTRHNVGFAVADYIAEIKKVSFTQKSKFKAEIAEYVSEEKILIAKPLTFYNNVGESYRAICDFYKIAPKDTLVIHDELALPFGTLRSRIGGSDAGNNGIKSINQHGGDTSLRLRIGVANALRSRIGDVDFVLGRFTQDEQAAITEAKLPLIFEIVDKFVANEHAITSHRLPNTDDPR